MINTEGMSCDYLQSMAAKIENLTELLESNTFQGEIKFAQSQTLERLKPEFLQHFYEHETHDCLGRLSMVAFKIESEFVAHQNRDSNLAEIIHLRRVA